jgi:hypothetical protein
VQLTRAALPLESRLSEPQRAALHAYVREQPPGDPVRVGARLLKCVTGVSEPQ